ncbi:MAG: hypothetical protein GY750_10845 [Lentisphaerae bacterium]|nr:hypothetical protein [Lentisphaerota bacterium]MCP4101908.1 hypothetical protein [Lentisphaerota bacterium]
MRAEKKAEMRIKKAALYDVDLTPITTQELGLFRKMARLCSHPVNSMYTYDDRLLLGSRNYGAGIRELKDNRVAFFLNTDKMDNALAAGAGGLTVESGLNRSLVIKMDDVTVASICI